MNELTLTNTGDEEIYERIKSLIEHIPYHDGINKELLFQELVALVKCFRFSEAATIEGLRTEHEHAVFVEQLREALWGKRAVQ